jgi:hypothetical protein
LIISSNFSTDSSEYILFLVISSKIVFSSSNLVYNSSSNLFTLSAGISSKNHLVPAYIAQTCLGTEIGE